MNISLPTDLKVSTKTQNLIACILFLTVVPILAHLSFSWRGFYPGDDGYNLAFSRRLLEGQVPYRDFIDPYPIGTALFHAPFVLLGGDYTFWISRLFVWFQFACIAWAGTIVILKSLKILLPVLQKFLLAMIAFMLTTHFYPIMAFHTIDGFFFLSLGLLLYYEGTPRRKLLGSFVVGLAYLCKQSFLPTVPLFLLILGDWRRPRLWLPVMMPGIIFLTYLGFVGAIPDAVIQLSSHADLFFANGIKSYLNEYMMPWGILLGYFAMVLSFGEIKIAGIEKRMSLQRSLGAFMLYSTPFGLSIALSQNIHTAWILFFGLFGTALGATGYFIQKEREWQRFARVGILVLLLGWSVSLSLGYNTPALAAGLFSVLLVAYCHTAFQAANKDNTIRKLPAYLLIALFTVSIFSYASARQKYLWLDKPVSELTQSLDGVFPGVRLIKTNLNIYQFLVDFNIAVEKTKGCDFTVIPGVPAYWVKSRQKNPLCIDWALAWGWMAGKRALINRVLQDLESHRSKIIIILQKGVVDCSPKNFRPLRGGEFPQYVRDHFKKIDETKYFELYQ